MIVAMPCPCQSSATSERHFRAIAGRAHVGGVRDDPLLGAGRRHQGVALGVVHLDRPVLTHSRFDAAEEAKAERLGRELLRNSAHCSAILAAHAGEQCSVEPSRSATSTSRAVGRRPSPAAARGVPAASPLRSRRHHHSSWRRAGPAHGGYPHRALRRTPESAQPGLARAQTISTTAEPSRTPGAQILERPPGIGERICPARRCAPGCAAPARETRRRRGASGWRPSGRTARPRGSRRGRTGCRTCGCRRRRPCRPSPSARSAAGTSSPAEAKMIAASSSSGRRPRASCPPTRRRARARTPGSARRPARVNANTRRPWKRATWAMMCAEEPKP